MRRKYFLGTGLALILAVASTALLIADDDERREHGGKEGHHAMATFNQGYEDACGDCHFAYQPWLLPARSWEVILAGLDDHYGNALPVSDEERNALAGYLTGNAADRSAGKRSRKIMRDLGGEAPLRVSEVPYIRHKHHELDAAVFARPSIGGLGNCPACHVTAAQGDYDDDNVSIPR